MSHTENKGEGKLPMDHLMLAAVAFGLFQYGASMLHCELITRSALQKVRTGKDHPFAHYYTPIYVGLLGLTTCIFVGLLPVIH